jgi:hypothetical protein
MKQIWALLFILLTAVSFSGCSSDDDDDTTEETSINEDGGDGDDIDVNSPPSPPGEDELGYEDGEGKDDVEEEERVTAKIVGTTPEEGRFDKETSEAYVVDTATGLLWERMGDAVKTNHSEAVQACADLDKEGKEWRLPTVGELVAIADFSKDASLCGTLSSTFGDETPILWASDRDPENSENALRVNFAYGADIASKSSDEVNNFICVAGENANLGKPLDDRDLVPHDAGSNGHYVADHDFGLLWEDSESPEKLTYEEAVAHCENLDIEGYTGWRLPNFNELYSTVNLGVELSGDREIMSIDMAGTMDSLSSDVDGDMMVTAIDAGIDSNASNLEEAVITAVEEEVVEGQDDKLENSEVVHYEEGAMNGVETAVADQRPIADHPAMSQFHNFGESVDGEKIEYWTTTLYHGDENRAWTVKFADGRNNYAEKDSQHFVRCVKDASTDEEDSE